MNTPANKYLDGAVAIGRTLVRDAVWADRRCFWLTQSEVKHEFGTRPVVTACSPGLTDGARGVRLFLTRLLAHDQNPLIEDVVGGVDCYLKNGPPNAASDQRDSISSVWDCRANDDHPSAELYQRLNQLHAAVQGGPIDQRQQAAISRLATEAIQYFESEPDRFDCFIDPLFADAVMVTATLMRNHNSSNVSQLIADHVLEKSEQHGQPWQGGISREYPSISLTEGLAGVGHFLLRLAAEETPPLLSPNDLTCDSSETL